LTGESYLTRDHIIIPVYHLLSVYVCPRWEPTPFLETEDPKGSAILEEGGIVSASAVTSVAQRGRSHDNGTASWREAAVVPDSTQAKSTGFPRRILDIRGKDEHSSFWKLS